MVITRPILARSVETGVQIAELIAAIAGTGFGTGVARSSVAIDLGD